MTGENNENIIKQDAAKEARQALLDMAREWHKNPAAINHAIKAYKDIIATFDSENPAVGEAKQALLKIAKDWEKKGQKYAAIRLYKELMAYK